MISVDKVYLPVVTTAYQFNKLFGNLEDLKPNPNVARFYFIRHGESTANEQGINAGQTVDVDLTQKGIRQVNQTARILAEKVEKLDIVYITPLKRTAQSFGEVRKVWEEQKRSPMPQVVVEPAFIEKHCGSLEGKGKTEYEPYKIKEEEEIKKLDSFDKKFDYKMVPDQESLKEVFERRAQPAINKIAQANKGKNILVVGHVGMMRSMILGTLASRKIEPVDLEVRSFDLPNGAILVFESDGSSVDLIAQMGLKFLRQ